MEQSKAGDWEARALEWIGRNWKLVTFIVWLGFSIWFIADKWQ